MVNFFIDRPIFAWVLAIVTMMAGALAITTLPIAQYPTIAPPAIAISAIYPGASADIVQSTVTQVIEQQLNGIDHLLYFGSESDADGSMTITLYFEQGTNPDTAQVQVQNKLALATPLLPVEVQQQGLRVVKATRNFLLTIGFYSSDGSMTGEDVSDYIASHVQDPISRTQGVGDFTLFGTQYAMRIWLDPAKLTNYGLTPVDVDNALQAQNLQVPTGELGGLPSVRGQRLHATIVGPQRLTNAEQFGGVLLKVNTDGSRVLLKDVAQIGLGAESYSLHAEYNARPAAGLAVKLASGANALDTAKAIHATMDGLAPFFPPGLKLIYPYDTTPFVRVSIDEVVKTLFEAIVLVFLVIYLFLQNIRATLIPTIAVPVVLLGAFGVLAAAGYSMNTLTMFGMVLAIGLLVDDAIVVVENVERVMDEEKLSPKEATRKSMGEITGALVGIALVLSAVFLPMAFFSGSTGVIYRQFSITIISAMSLSVLVALVFTPSLCATLLRPRVGDAHERGRGFFGWFNRSFGRMNRAYEHGVNHVTHRTRRYLLAYLLIAVAMAVMFGQVPRSFLPDEDQGILFVQVSAPPGAPRELTQRALDEARDYFLKDEASIVNGVFTVNGFSFGGRGQNAGLVFVRLKDWSDRPGAKNSVFALATRANQRFHQMRGATVVAFAPPAALELGNATGFDFELEDRGDLGHAALMRARAQLLEVASKDPRIGLIRPNGLDDEPQYTLDIDWMKASALGLSISDVNDTIGAGWGSSYVNQFVDRNRVKRVFVQGDSESRMLPADFGRWYIRNGVGQMVPFSAFAAAHWSWGSPKLERYNGVSALEFQGAPSPGKSTGDAIAAMQAAVAKLPKGVGYEWTAVRHLAQRRVSVSRGALRELVDTLRGVVGGAPRHHRHHLRYITARIGQRCFLSGRSADHRGPVGQERDPHRGVRQGKP